MLCTILISHGFFRACFSIGFLALAPGYFALRSIIGYGKETRSGDSRAKILSYSLGLSLITLMLTGLFVNQLMPVFGNKHPFSVKVLTVAIGVVTMGFIAGSAQHAYPEKKQRHKLKFYLKKYARTVLFALPGLLITLLAVGGAITLNNGGPSWLATVVMGLIGLYSLVLVWANPARVGKQYAYALYGICLSILLGTSMRGWNITGHDVMQEFQVFELTLQHAAWHMQYYQDAYNACLSITILPTILQKLTGISDPYIYKFVFQLFFAALAPIMYITLREYVPKKTALLSVLVFLSFPTFLTDMTMLNRQAVALLCFVLSIQAGLDKKLPRLQKDILALIFLIGMVLSHYSTSYIAIGALSFVFVFGLIHIPVRKMIPKKWHIRKVKIGFSIYDPKVILVAVAALFMWGTVITHTSGNISQTISGVVDNIPNIFDGKPVKSSTPTPPKLSGTPLNQDIQVQNNNKQLPTQDYYSASVTRQYPLTSVQPAVSPESAIVRFLHIPKSLITLLFNTIRQLYGAFIIGMMGLGVLLIVFGWVKTKLPPQYVLLGIGTLLIIALQVLLPSIINYGLTRAIQQSLLVLALPIVLGCFWALGKIKIPEEWHAKIVGTALVAFFLVLSGFAASLTGGFKPVLALNNSGFYYEAYLTHQDEIAADQWLAANSPKGSRVYADEFARRKMIAYSNSTIFAQPTLVPSAIPVDSYVYLSYGNTTFNEVPLYYNGSLIYHNVPYGFLNANKNLLYSSGQVLIYK